MNLVKIDQNNRIIGFRSGSYTESDKTDDEVIVDDFDWDRDRYGILNLSTHEIVCDEECVISRKPPEPFIPPVTESTDQLSVEGTIPQPQ